MQHEHNVQALLQSNGFHSFYPLQTYDPTFNCTIQKNMLCVGLGFTFGMKPNSHQILFDLCSLLTTPYSCPTYPPCAPSTYPNTFLLNLTSFFFLIVSITKFHIKVLQSFHTKVPPQFSCSILKLLWLQFLHIVCKGEIAQGEQQEQVLNIPSHSFFCFFGLIYFFFFALLLSLQASKIFFNDLLQYLNLGFIL